MYVCILPTLGGFDGMMYDSVKNVDTRCLRNAIEEDELILLEDSFTFPSTIQKSDFWYDVSDEVIPLPDRDRQWLEGLCRYYDG